MLITTPQIGRRDTLIGLGAHPYLVFMSRLRLDMTRAPGAFEHF